MRALSTAGTTGAGLYVQFPSGEAHEVAVLGHRVTVDPGVERRPAFGAAVSRCTVHHSLTTPASATIDLI